MGNLIRIVMYNDGYLCSVNEADLSENPVSTKFAYDSETRVIYWYYMDYHKNYLGGGNYCGYMSPYISENGKFCRFIDDKIVEIG